MRTLRDSGARGWATVRIVEGHGHEGPAFDAGWLLEQLGDAVIATDASGKIRYANTAACKLLGYPGDTLVGLPLVQIVPSRLRDQHLAGLARLIETGEARLAGGPPVRVAALRADGTEIDIELALAVDGLDDRGRFVAVASMRDVGDRIALEREIDLARYLRASVEVADRLHGAASVDEAFAAVLPALCDNLDWDLASIWHPGDEQILVSREIWTSGRTGLDVFEQMTRAIGLRFGEGLPGRCYVSGTPVWAEDVRTLDNFPRRNAAAEAGIRTGVAFPLLGDEGVLAVVEMFSKEARSIDADLQGLLATIGRQFGQFLERMQVEADLRYRAALLASQYEAMSDAMLVVSPDRRVLSFNRRFLELFGLTEDEVSVGGPTPIVLEKVARQFQDLDAFRARVEHAHGHRDETMSFEVELSDGRIVEMYGAPVVDTEGVYYGRAWYLRDITERRRAVTALASLADTLQRSLLPPHLPAIAGLDLASLYRPGGEGLQVGGDFYDVFAVGRNEWGFVIGDVCGKGASAATVTALARYTARTEAMHARTPGEVLAMVNDALLREEREAPFLTAAYLSLQGSTAGLWASVSCAGHPLPLLLDATGHVEQLGVPGSLLGVFEGIELVDVTRRLSSGDVIVLFTDGVTEARDPSGREFGLDRLAEVVRSVVGQPAAAVVAAIDEAVSRYRGDAPRDDLAVLVVRVV